MPRTYGLLLAPGAGADSSSPALVTIEALLSKQFAVRRMDFPYRLAGRKSPDREPVLAQAVRDALEAFSKTAKLPAERIFVGGRSMGGRMCSIAASEGMTAAGLVLMSYPLHPPGRPEKLRTAHFSGISVPCLFVSGTRDAFGSPKEFALYTKAIKGSVDFEWIEGGDHGMSKYNDRVADVVVDWLRARHR